MARWSPCAKTARIAGQTGGHTGGAGVAEGIDGPPRNPADLAERIGVGELLGPDRLVDVVQAPRLLGLGCATRTSPTAHEQRHPTTRRHAAAAGPAGRRPCGATPGSHRPARSPTAPRGASRRDRPSGRRGCPRDTVRPPAASTQGPGPSSVRQGPCRSAHDRPAVGVEEFVGPHRLDGVTPRPRRWTTARSQIARREAA